MVRVHNYGAAFSFLAGAGGWQRWFFTGVGLVAGIFIVWMLRSRPGEKLFGFAMASILGGALGNVLDRLLHYSTTLNIKGESYRLKEKRRAGLLGRSNGEAETEPETSVSLAGQLA